MDIYRYIIYIYFSVPPVLIIFFIFSFFSTVFQFVSHGNNSSSHGGPWVAMETEVDTGGQGVGPSRGVGFQKPVGWWL